MKSWPNIHSSRLGEVWALDAHYEGPRPAPSRVPRPRTTSEQWFCALGGAAQAFLVGAPANGNTRLSAELDILLALGAAHGEQLHIAALSRAVAFGRFRAADVRSILSAGTAVPTPVPPGGALIVDLPIADTRSLADYNLTSLGATDSHNGSVTKGVTS